VKVTRGKVRPELNQVNHGPIPYFAQVKHCGLPQDSWFVPALSSALRRAYDCIIIH